jgi:hypothetical protein
MANRKPIQVEYQTLVVMWLALLASQAIFFAIVWFARPNIFSAEARGSLLDNLPLVTVVFAAIAILFFVLSFVLSRQHMRRAVRDHDAVAYRPDSFSAVCLASIVDPRSRARFRFQPSVLYLWLALGALGIFLHFLEKEISTRQPLTEYLPRKNNVCRHQSPILLTFTEHCC